MKALTLPDWKYQIIHNVEPGDRVFLTDISRKFLWFVENSQPDVIYPLTPPTGSGVITSILALKKDCYSNFFYITRNAARDDMYLEFQSGTNMNMGPAMHAVLKAISDKIAFCKCYDNFSVAIIDPNSQREVTKIVNYPTSSKFFNVTTICGDNEVILGDSLKFAKLYDIRENTGEIASLNISLPLFSRRTDCLWMNKFSNGNKNILHVTSTGQHGNMNGCIDLRFPRADKATIISCTDWQYSFRVMCWSNTAPLLGFFSHSVINGSVRLTICNVDTRELVFSMVLDRLTDSSYRQYAGNLKQRKYHASCYSNCFPLLDSHEFQILSERII